MPKVTNDHEDIAIDSNVREHEMRKWCELISR